ncbi:unnamed protein product [Cylicocyclus nassatus]|uniref:SUZ domain-containing protein n=1 Tax=Cylicocyclus nassatus TaxID=53992 RepID=A0AA36H796_CYLNA|nr:unnamed protein product [Cylicocyclus nassatus]
MSTADPALPGSADSSPGDVAEDWENDEASESMEKQLSERFKQVRILQRAQADKEARKEKAAKTQEEARLNPSLIPTPSVVAAGPGGVPPAPVRILRRPESSEKIREEKYQAQRAKAEEAARNQLTPEQKEALYVKARDRILGPEYKPDNSQCAQNVAVVNRSRSPEQIRVPRFSDLPLAASPLDPSLGGPIMITSIPPSTMAPPIQTKQSQQKPVSLLAMSSPPVGLPMQQPSAIGQDVIGQQQPCMVTSPPPSQQAMNAYPQYVIAQSQQHIPYAMTLGGKQTMVPPYIDTTRPPPGMSLPSMAVNPQIAMSGAGMSVAPPPGMRQGYYNPQNVVPNPQYQLRHCLSQQQQQSGLTYGPNVMSIYPPGTLTAAMRGTAESGCSASIATSNAPHPRKGKRNRNKRENQ